MKNSFQAKPFAFKRVNLRRYSEGMVLGAGDYFGEQALLVVGLYKLNAGAP